MSRALMSLDVRSVPPSLGANTPRVPTPRTLQVVPTTQQFTRDKAPPQAAPESDAQPQGERCTSLMHVKGLRQFPGEKLWGAGFPNVARKAVKPHELPIPQSGFVTTRSGPLVMEPGETYVYLIDRRGLTYAKERQGELTVTHPMICDASGEAAAGGEMMFRDGKLFWNTKSGRFSGKVTDRERPEIAALFEELKKASATTHSVEFARDLPVSPRTEE